MDFDVKKLKWTREPADFSISAYMPAVPKTPHSKQYSLTWSLRNANGKLMTDSSPTRNNPKRDLNQTIT